MLSDVSHACAFRDVLTDQAVRIFVGAALPRVIRRREEEAYASGSFDVGVVVKLGAVIGGDGFALLGMATNEIDHAPVELLFGSSLELADDRVAGFAFDDRDEAMQRAFADDRIDLPVPDLVALLSADRSLTDMSLAGEPAAAVVGGVALAPLLGRAAQVPMQRTAEVAVVPDMTIDRS